MGFCFGCGSGDNPFNGLDCVGKLCIEMIIAIQKQIHIPISVLGWYTGTVCRSLEENLGCVSGTEFDKIGTESFY